MGLSKITINRAQGGLNAALPGQDHISAVLIMEESLSLLDGATGLLTQGTVQGLPLYNLEDAEALGITKSSANAATIWQHLRDFWTLAPGAQLYVIECTATNANAITTADYGVDLLAPAIQDAQDLAGGSIRQMAILHDSDNATPVIEAAVLGAMNTKLTALEADNKPLIAAISTIYAAGTAVSGAPDLTASDYERIVAVSGSTTATAPADSGTINFAAPLGAILGMMAAASVHESIGWVAKFDGLNGLGYLEPSHSDGEVGALIDKGYVDFVKYTGLNGLFVAKSVTAAASTSDYNRIEKVRVMDKAARGVRTVLLPRLNSPVYLESDGTLQLQDILFYENLAGQPLETMQTAGEISAFEVFVDPVQDVLSTGKLTLSIKIIPVGSSEEIIVNLGYTLNLA